MNKKDFTPEFIQDKIFDFIVNQDFPDELYEVGSRISITDLVDVEISSITKSESNFIVNGSATVETETDMGEGDTSSGDYPMTFSYEFDEDGEIEEQRRRRIDTSSFLACRDDYEAYIIEDSWHSATFMSSNFAIL